MSIAYRFANPERFESVARALSPWVYALAFALLAVGLYGGLFLAPPDYQQGESVRIMYVHVPAAWMALFIYTLIAASSLVGFVWRHPLADAAAKAAAPLGAAFTFLALVTGSLWGKPTWGTWWAWDARLTSVLILFFLYLGYMAVWEAIDDQLKAARIASVVALVGAVNVPIIKFSVDWWNSLHQPASVSRLGAPTIHPDILWPLLVMGAAYMALFAAMHLERTRAEILGRRLARLQAERAAREAEAF